AGVEATLTIEQGPSRGSLTLFPGQTATLGGAPGCELALGGPEVAPRHVSVALDERALWVMDLGAPGGSTLEGERLVPHQAVAAFPGDALALGGHQLRITLLGRGVRARKRAPRQLSDPAVPPGELELVRELG